MEREGDDEIEWLVMEEVCSDCIVTSGSKAEMEEASAQLKPLWLESLPGCRKRGAKKIDGNFKSKESRR